MSTNSALAPTDQQLRAALCCVPAQADATEQCPLTWPAFLAVLKSFCVHRGWDLVYESEDDFSCAIYAQEEPFITALNDGREDSADKTISGWQLALF